MKPRDPVSENMDILNGKPVKAFISQDHRAHLAVHISAMQDPKLMQVAGQNPNAQAMMAAFAAHVQEHVAFEYRRRIEEEAGVPLPPPDAEMSPETEVAISQLAAAAAQQLLQKDQAEMAQQQAQQAAQDPVIQMQMQELQIKAKEVDLKEKKLLIDAAATNDKMDIEKERIAAQERIAGLQVGAKVATDKANLSAKQELEGLRVGVQVARESQESARGQQAHAMEMAKAMQELQQPEQPEQPETQESE